jgi:hypothetical protein
LTDTYNQKASPEAWQNRQAIFRCASTLCKFEAKTQRQKPQNTALTDRHFFDGQVILCLYTTTMNLSSWQDLSKMVSKMSYAAPRKAKIKVVLTAKVIGTGRTVEYKAGKACQVQRNPGHPGMFIVWFSRTNVAHIPAERLPETIEYADGKPEGWQ